jgi:hypothetical protein
MNDTLSLLKDKLKSISVPLIACIIFALVCSLLTYHYTAKHYQAKYNTLNEKYVALNNEYTQFKSAISDTEKEREDKIIAKAETDKQNKVPVVAPLFQDTTTTISYDSKQSKNDADVEITNTVNPVKVSYNGKTEELNTTTTEKQTTEGGKVVVKQDTTTTIDIDSIVNRQIADRIDDYNQKIKDLNHDKAVLKRQKTQQTIWGAIIGIGIGHGAGLIKF